MSSFPGERPKPAQRGVGPEVGDKHLKNSNGASTDAPFFLPIEVTLKS